MPEPGSRMWGGGVRVLFRSASELAAYDGLRGGG